MFDEDGLAADRRRQERSFNQELTEQMMRRAIELSRHGMRAGDGGPFGAVIAMGEGSSEKGGIVW